MVTDIVLKLSSASSERVTTTQSIKMQVTNIGERRILTFNIGVIIICELQIKTNQNAKSTFVFGFLE